MNRPVDPDAPDRIAQAFGSDCVVVPIASILPVYFEQSKRELARIERLLN
jgi:hypothetical protein